jgi:hypothetical protein
VFLSNQRMPSFQTALADGGLTQARKRNQANLQSLRSQAMLAPMPKQALPCTYRHFTFQAGL